VAFRPVRNPSNRVFQQNRPVADVWQKWRSTSWFLDPTFDEGNLIASCPVLWRRRPVLSAPLSRSFGGDVQLAGCQQVRFAITLSAHGKLTGLFEHGNRIEFIQELRPRLRDVVHGDIYDSVWSWAEVLKHLDHVAGRSF